MKVKYSVNKEIRDKEINEDIKYIDIEINNVKYKISQCEVEPDKLVINKVNFNNVGRDAIKIHPRCSNEIEIE